MLNLDGEFIEHSDESLVHTLVRADGIGEWYIHHLVVADANHHVALSVKDGINDTGTQSAGEDAVTGGR